MADDGNARKAAMGVDVRGCPVFNWQLSPVDRRDPIVCRLPPAILVYHIHASGLVKRLTPNSFNAEAESGPVKYVYFDSGNARHELGLYTYKKVRRRAPGGAATGEHIRLIDLNGIQDYSSGALKYGFKSDSSRPYINDLALASLFGAMLEVGYTDISCNGFSRVDGSSAPSKSHINGINGDFKYLRVDGTTQSQKSLHIDKNAGLMDEGRQNAFNNALYRFGWKSMLSWRYTKNGATLLLAHATHFADHHHHIHLQGFAPTVEDE